MFFFFENVLSCTNTEARKAKGTRSRFPDMTIAIVNKKSLSRSNQVFNLLVNHTAVEFFLSYYSRRLFYCCENCGAIKFVFFWNNYWRRNIVEMKPAIIFMKADNINCMIHTSTQFPCSLLFNEKSWEKQSCSVQEW